MKNIFFVISFMCIGTVSAGILGFPSYKDLYNEYWDKKQNSSFVSDLLINAEYNELSTVYIFSSHDLVTVVHERTLLLCFKEALEKKYRKIKDGLHDYEACEPVVDLLDEVEQRLIKMDLLFSSLSER